MTLKWEVQTAASAPLACRPFSVAVYQNRGANAPRILLGSYGAAGDIRFPAEFIPKLRGVGPIEPGPEERGPELPNLRQAGRDEKIAAFEQFAARNPENPRTYTALAAPLLFMTPSGKPEAELRAVGERVIRQSEALRPGDGAARNPLGGLVDCRVERSCAGRSRVCTPRGGAVARHEDPPAIAEAVLRTLAWCLHRGGEKADAALDARVAAAADRADRALAAAESALLPEVAHERPRSKGHTVLV